MKKSQGEIKKHLKTCDFFKKQSNLYNFQFVKKSLSDGETIINEALEIKNENPPLKKIFSIKAVFPI